MGLFSSIFGAGFRDPPREKWDHIIDTIHARLAEDRPVFFKACVEILSMLPDVSIRNRTMTRPVELAITVYQLHLGRELIANRQYVRPEVGNAFVSMLYTDACRYGSILERDELARRYWPREEEDKQGMEILWFYSDIATHITGIEAPAREALLLCDSTIKRFTIVARLAVATSFGDRETAQELRDAFARK